MSGYRPKNYLKKGLAVIGASETDTPISEPFPITASGSLHLVVAIKAADVTDTTGLAAKLQTSIDGGTTWHDTKTADITTDGWVFIKLLAEVAGDQTHLPLLSIGRVVITTGTGDEATISDVQVLQEL